MQKVARRLLAARTPASTPGTAPIGAFPAANGPCLTKLLLVDFREGAPLADHPQLAPYLKSGWTIRSATPRLVEAAGPRLLVVLNQGLNQGGPAKNTPLRRIK